MLTHQRSLRLLCALVSSLAAAACDVPVSESDDADIVDEAGEDAGAASDAALHRSDAARPDASRPVLDASLSGADASKPAADASNPGADVGPARSDAGQPGMDAGAPRADAGHDAGAAPPGIHVIVEPSDSGAALLAALQNAKSSIHMTMYLVSWSNVSAALVAAHQAGLDVKVVLDQSSATSTYNTPVYQTLVNYGMAVHWAPSAFTYTHEKCVIIDGHEAWIMTMNASYAGATANREYLAVDTLAADVADAEAIFAADFADTAFPTYQGPLVLSPVNSQARLVTLISSAKSTLDIEDEELSDPTSVTAIVDRAQAGVVVHVVLSDITPSGAGATAISQLKSAGAKVVSLSVPYVHAKAVVADGKTAYVGSANLTSVSLTHNRELGVIFSVLAEVSLVRSTIAADFAAGTPL